MRFKKNIRFRAFLFAACTLIISMNVKAQTLPDPFVNSATVAITPTAFAETGNSLSCQFLNVSPIGTLNLFPPTTLTIQLSKMEVLGTFTPASITGAGASFFNWTYNSTLKMITGTLKDVVPPLSGGVINIGSLKVIDSATVSSPQIGFNVNVNATGSNNASTTNDFTSSYTYTQGSPLPVEWLGFDVNRYGATAHLNWSTGAEINLSHYIPQFSVNGFDFQDLEKVNPKGYGLRNNYYYLHDISKFIQNASVNPVLYYRVKQYDQNQQFTITDVKQINLTSMKEGGFAVQCFPNPATDVINVSVDGINLNDAIIYQLVDMQGRIVFKQKNITFIETDYIVIPTSKLARGSYMLQVDNDEFRYFNKIILK